MLQMFILLGIVVVLALLGNLRDQAAKAEIQAIYDSMRKSCPPHKWVYREQPGMPGTEYMICDTCKKVPGYVGRDQQE